MSKIVLTTLNARFIHSAFGLRYLKANMGALQSETVIREFTLEPWPIDIAEQLLADEPQIIGLGVYIWNIEQTTRLVALIKAVRPDIIIVLGGPEVSHEWEQQAIVQQADYLICGQADVAFGQLCAEILSGSAPDQKVISPPLPQLQSLALPYDLYTDEDIANRVIYVEASRGCPFKCEFCLSALDKTSWSFNLDRFLAEMDKLHKRGVRHFKFVDRTFNLDINSSLAILEFFYQRLDDQLFLHFEVVPDHLPDRLKQILARFPPGSLQLEIGVQSFNPEVQTLISRRQDNKKAMENLDWIRRESHAHIHADLIMGLPGENMQSFARGFDQLVSLNPHEIQVGILKRLRGSPIIRHTDAYQLRFNPNPPYDILSTNCIDFQSMQQLNRFARYWEMIANAERFKTSLPLLLGERPFDRFMALSNWLYQTTGQVHRIALKRLFKLIHNGATANKLASESAINESLLVDFKTAGLKGYPPWHQGTSE
ncbi:MAG: DUF4080 domain-containing protein [Gammaproteobacteria bacterium]|nr:DUF4080 domain-containing protein [Gammaproteobacteria bacterium]